MAQGPREGVVGQPFGGGAQASIVCGRPVFADWPASVCFTSSMQASMASGAPVNAMRLRLFVELPGLVAVRYSNLRVAVEAPQSI